ncbi:hypothetical protein BC829DRAFT_447458 [Chytridium lagenaria]|nr:hypothetical protein BC829DRAFT_447458 [Chytridium lagenaria]
MSQSSKHSVEEALNPSQKPVSQPPAISVHFQKYFLSSHPKFKTKVLNSFNHAVIHCPFFALAITSKDDEFHPFNPDVSGDELKRWGWEDDKDREGGWDWTFLVYPDLGGDRSFVVEERIWRRIVRRMRRVHRVRKMMGGLCGGVVLERSDDGELGLGCLKRR